MVPVSPLTVQKCQSVQDAASSTEYARMAFALNGTGAAMVVFGRKLIKSNTILGQAVVNTQLRNQSSLRSLHQRNQSSLRSLHQRNQSSLRSLHQRNQSSLRSLHQRNQSSLRSLHPRNQSSLRSLHQRNQVSNQPKKQKMLTRKLWPRPEDVF
jgi:hypothetical protein